MPPRHHPTPPLPPAEWLLTNGLGGFAMGTVSGVPTRRYHGLLIAATRPPVGRVMALNATVDRLTTGLGSPSERAFELSGFRFAGLGEVIHPDGPTRIESFTRDHSATWVYSTPAARVTRRVHLHHGVNTVSIAYTVERTGPRTRSPLPLRLTIRPLLSLRGFHSLMRRNHAGRLNSTPQERGVTVERGGLKVHLTSDHARFTPDPRWWENFFYPEEAARCQDCIEDLHSPGEFTLDLAPDKQQASFILRASLGELPPPATAAIETDRAERDARLARLINHTVKGPAPDPSLPVLIAASTDFIVARHTPDAPESPGVSIIAGYPWFGDWGRDTFISMRGLLLTTGRFAEARATLAAFAPHRRRGLIPNLFDEHSGLPEYNTVDASLWFIQAACDYTRLSGDRAFWDGTLAPACLDVVAHFRRGTDFNIAMDPFDRLITAGTPATQLTWMDARRDGVVFTPRHGKAVEINALWVSGLRRIAETAGPDGTDTAPNLNTLADAAARSFRAAFWNPASGCLLDCLTPSDNPAGAVWEPDPSLRPNQIFAVSLPHSPLDVEQQRAVVNVVKARLLTPRGVRTLDPADPRYRPRYEGNLFDRDSAYHNGTAWPWLLGPLAEAVMRADSFSEPSRREAREILAPLLATLDPAHPEPGACLGQLAEVYDAEPPQRPQGCPAQAWSVAEALRVLCL